jgi:excisionase family DNA binding protein
LGKSFDIENFKKLRALTVQQAAFYAATSRDVVLRWLNSGSLGYYILPNTSSKKVQRRILREELDNFLESQYRKTTPRRSQHFNEITNRKRPKLELLPKVK